MSNKLKKSSLKPNTKETLLSEEVIIPVAFWDGAPKHHITCITKQTSRRRGDVILTGSSHGETIVWKPEGIPHGRGKAEKFPISSSGPYQWVPSVMFLGKNRTPIINFFCNMLYHGRPSVMVIHEDGDVIVWDLNGAGIVHCSTPENPILPFKCRKSFGFANANESFQYGVFLSHPDIENPLQQLCVLDLNTCTLSSKVLTFSHRIVDATLFQDACSQHLLTIQENHIVCIYNLLDQEIQPLLQFQTKLSSAAIGVDMAFDNQHVVIASANEIVVYDSQTQMEVFNYIDETKEWSGMQLQSSNFIDGTVAGLRGEGNVSKASVVVWQGGKQVEVLQLDLKKKRIRMQRTLNTDKVSSMFVGSDTVYVAEGDGVLSTHPFASERCFHFDMIEQFTDQDSEQCSASFLEMTRLGAMLCTGYSNGNIRIYNITRGELHLELREHECRVTCILLVCPDPAKPGLVGDGALFVGYENGHVCVWNARTGHLLLNHLSHFGHVLTLRQFNQDYYVFSTGSDNGVCSYLVLDLVVSMREVAEIVAKPDGPKVKVHWYRGHNSSVKKLYRTPWCISSDHLLVETDTGDLYCWGVSTSEFERHMDPLEAKEFAESEDLHSYSGRPGLPHLTKLEQEIYDMGSSQDLNCNILILDIHALGKYTPKSQSKKIDYIDADRERKLVNTLLLLLDFGLDADLEARFCNTFGVRKASLAAKQTFGFCGQHDSLVLPFPGCQYYRRWSSNGSMTGVHLLGIYTILSWLVKSETAEKKAAANKLVATYLIHLPKLVDNFCEPARESLSLFMLNSVMEIRLAASVLLEGVIDRMSENEKMQMLKKWKKQFLNEDNQRKQKIRNIIQEGKSHLTPDMSKIKRTSGDLMLGAIMLCMLQGYDASLIDSQTATDVFTTLQSTLEDEVHSTVDLFKISLCCDYLSKVVDHWHNQAKAPSILFKKLLEYSGSDWGFVTKAARTALLMCGRAMPLQFVETMGDEATNSVRPNGPQQALVAIATLTKKYPQSLVKHLPKTVEVIIRCLDPSHPNRRRSLLKAATATLRQIVEKFPTSSFHQEKQHFSVGTGRQRDYRIIVYDLRTATKWKSLKGHTGRITAVEFSEDGNYLASYAAYERPPTLRSWQLSQSGIVSQFFGTTAKCINLYQLPPFNKDYHTIEHLQNTNIWWRKKSVKLTREDGSETSYQMY